MTALLVDGPVLKAGAAPSPPRPPPAQQRRATLPGRPDARPAPPDHNRPCWTPDHPAKSNGTGPRREVAPHPVSRANRPGPARRSPRCGARGATPAEHFRLAAVTVTAPARPITPKRIRRARRCWAGMGTGADGSERSFSDIETSEGMRFSRSGREWGAGRSNTYPGRGDRP